MARDEIVALFDETGAVVGSAPRWKVRGENLIHGATGVIVRDSSGRIYVHRRTDTKDVYPGYYDFTAGGVLLAGEDPREAAVREACEELGVAGVALRSLGEGFYADEHTRYYGFRFECVYEGPIRHQAEEVAWGAWLTPDDLRAWIEDPDKPFMPDALALLGQFV